AEIFDPASRSWAATANTATAHAGGTATVLPDGRVLLAGGMKNFIEVEPAAAVEIYDPATATWSQAASLLVGRLHHTATLLNNGRVLIAGGQTISGAATGLAEIYDPSTNTWTAAGSMASGRMWHTATPLPSGDVLIVGGLPTETSASWATAEIYSPS